METILKREDFIFDPNEECPCGSNTEFGLCCYQKAIESSHDNLNDYSEERMRHENNEMWKNTNFSNCLIGNSECSPSIIGAHSIQNSQVFDCISESGHIYWIQKNITTILTVSNSKKLVKIRPVHLQDSVDITMRKSLIL